MLEGVVFGGTLPEVPDQQSSLSLLSQPSMPTVPLARVEPTKPSCLELVLTEPEVPVSCLSVTFGALGEAEEVVVDAPVSLDVQTPQLQSPLAVSLA